MTAETGGLQPQAKVADATRSQKRRRGLSSQRVWRAHGPPTPQFQALASRAVQEYISVVFKPPSLWYFATAAMGNMYWLYIKTIQFKTKRVREICSGDHVCPTKLSLFNLS